MPTLRILDFDQTVTIEHTSQTPGLYTAAANTKEGLSELVIHNDRECCAIATFHKDPHYVLTYLLPLLGLTHEAIRRQEIKLYPHHQLMKFYLIGCKYPLIIATLHADNYRDHYQALSNNGKNEMLRSISDELPPCDEYHFYEDTERWYTFALNYFKNFHCYHVQTENPVFTIVQRQNPAAMEQLKNMLKAYLANQQEKQSKFELVTNSLKTLSFYASSSNNSSITLPQSKLESEQNQVVNALIQFLDFGPAVAMESLELLGEGELGLVIKDWENKTGLVLQDFICEMQRQREEQYDSADDHDDVSELGNVLDQ